MWLLLAIPVAAFAAYEFAKMKFGPKPSEPNTKAPPKGTGTVDGKGTGVLDSSLVDGQHGTGVLDVDPLVAQAAAEKVANELAAKRAAESAAAHVAELQTPQGAVEAAATAAEAVKQQMIAALNTPEGDRTPEQLALLGGLASLPTT